MQIINLGEKSYHKPSPDLILFEGNGWTLIDRLYIPEKSLLQPASLAVLELIKCGCKGKAMAH